MQEVLYIFAKTVSLVIDIVSISMFIRMILSLFNFGSDPSENKLYMISCYITEPFIMPVRAIMVHLNIGQDSPIDWAFFITSILLGLIGGLLPVI